MTQRDSIRDFGGPAFCLSLELGLSRNDEAHAAAALRAIWSCPILAGPWCTPGDIGKVAPDGDPASAGYGVLSSGLIEHPLPFHLSLIREQRARSSKSPADMKEVRIEFGIQTQQPSDWATLNIPVKALKAIWPVDFTWSVSTQPWLLQLSRALADVADHVHARAPILGGVMGEEASGCWRIPTQIRAGEAEQGYPPLAILSSTVVDERGGLVLTRDLWRYLAPQSDPESMPSGLLYVSPKPTACLTGA